MVNTCARRLGSEGIDTPTRAYVGDREKDGEEKGDGEERDDAVGGSDDAGEGIFLLREKDIYI
jgi:hypothetical protein